MKKTKEENREDGRIANLKGIPRSGNPYGTFESGGYDWDSGWLLQTQSWAGKPEKMCSHTGCTALHREADIEHSEDCQKTHTANVDAHFSVF